MLGAVLQGLALRSLRTLPQLRQGAAASLVEQVLETHHVSGARLELLASGTPLTSL